MAMDDRPLRGPNPLQRVLEPLLYIGMLSKVSVRIFQLRSPLLLEKFNEASASIFSSPLNCIEVLKCVGTSPENVRTIHKGDWRRQPIDLFSGLLRLLNSMAKK